MAKRKHYRAPWADNMRAMKVGDEVIIEPIGMKEKTLRSYVYGKLSKEAKKKWSIKKIYKIKRKV